MKTLGKPESLAAIGVFALIWALYLFTLPHHYSYDGLCYALDVERGPFINLFHPNHFLSSFVQRMLWKVGALAGVHIDALYWMQSVNAFAAALAVTALGIFLSRRAGLVGWLLAGLFGVSQCFWLEAADPGCYAFAACATVGLVVLLDRASLESPITVAILCGLAVLTHQMLALVLPAFLWRQPGRRATVIAASVALTAGLPYAVAASFHGPTWRDGLYWALGPAGPPAGTPILSGYWWSTDAYANALSWMSTLVASLVALQRWVWPVTVLLLGLLAIGLVSAWRRAQNLSEERLFFARLAVAAGALSIFQFFFYTGALRYRILLWPFMLSAITVGLRRLSAPRAVLMMSALVISVALVNGIGPVRNAHRQPPQAERLAWVVHQVTENDFFIFAGTPERSIDNVYLAYFAPQLKARSLKGYFFSHPDKNLGPLTEWMQTAHSAGSRILIEKDLSSLFPAWRLVREIAAADGYELAQCVPKGFTKEPLRRNGQRQRLG